MRKRAILGLKFLAAAGILYWMAATGKLRLSELAGALDRWPLLAAIAALVYLQIAITAWRWNLLLRAQGVRLGLRETFSLSMIGALFNTVIPSAVGGDVMKGYYVSRRAGPAKAQALATILVDRVLGLLGLVMLASCAAVWSFPSMWRHGALRALSMAAIAATVCGVAGLVAAVVAGPRLGSRLGSGRISAAISKVLTGLGGYRRHWATLPVGVLMSMGVHAAGCAGIYLALTAIGAPPLPLELLALAVPLGFMTTALPLSPAGIGVGQAAFFSLFQVAGAPAPAAGANAFTVFQVVMILVFLTGFYHYLSHKTVAGRPAEETVTAGSAS